jgi:hypothetical protein
MTGVARRSQRVVIEFHNGDWLVMLDTGDIRVAPTPEVALALVQRAAHRGNKGITVTRIEWRNTPAGFTAPGGSQ